MRQITSSMLLELLEKQLGLKRREIFLWVQELSLELTAKNEGEMRKTTDVKEQGIEDI